MKLIRHAFVSHCVAKCVYHFWLIPSIEFDWEHFNTEKYGDYKWFHLYFAWLFWSIDLEWEKRRTENA